MSERAHRPRLVSLVPSITETLCAFGLQGDVVGCTSFCTHPLSLRRTAKAVGGTKDARVPDILALAPTRVFVNTEENPPGLVAELRREGRSRGFLVHECFPRSPEEGMALVRDLGSLLGFEAAAREWEEACAAERTALEGATRGRPPLRYVYFIWRDPWMVAGDRTYIARMLALAGFENAVRTGDDMAERYPMVAPGDAVFDDPATALLFSSEPYAFKERHAEEFVSERAAARAGEAEAAPRWAKVDGRLLSWYGSATLDALRYLVRLRAALDAGAGAGAGGPMSPSAR